MDLEACKFEESKFGALDWPNGNKTDCVTSKKYETEKMKLSYK
jgi:hypothetical protein